MVTSPTLHAERIVFDIKVREGVAKKNSIFVAAEIPIHLYVNREHFITLLASPTMIKELAIGHLLAEGVAKRVDNAEIVVDGDKVKVSLPGVDARVKASRILRLVTTACGGRSDYLKLLDGISKPQVASELTVSAKKIARMVGDLNKVSATHKRTRGTHVAALFDEDGNLVCSAEDVGRHNAVDKVIGWVALRGRDCNRFVLVSSGRLTADIVLKAARIGMPIVVSITAPTDSGVRVAEKTGITLIGLANVAKMRVYTYPGRILPLNKG
ncbi:MAG: formate dehydrogenase accessory sulfurtransferase FdhD [Candidatus Bathyarchaeia archaeon]